MAHVASKIADKLTTRKKIFALRKPIGLTQQHSLFGYDINLLIDRTNFSLMQQKIELELKTTRNM